MLDAYADFILGVLEGKPDTTLDELVDRLPRERAVRIVRTAVWKFLDRRDMTHKKDRSRERAGTLRCEGDFNPIENAFAKLKAHVPEHAARTIDALEQSAAEALRQVQTCRMRKLLLPCWIRLRLTGMCSTATEFSASSIQIPRINVGDAGRAHGLVTTTPS